MGLERLRPMLWWCNLTGILPFGMELQPGANGPIFKRVTFSFKSPAIWWSIITSFVLVGNFSTLILSLLQHNPSPSKNGGINFKDLAARFHYIHYAVLTVLSFFLVMKYKLMKEAVEDIHLVDINIARHIVKPSCKTTSMTIIAFLISSGWIICGSLISLRPVLTESMMAQTMGREVAFGFLVSNTAMEFRTITLFAVFFVSNYVVANRISLLINVLQEYNPQAIKSTSGQYCEEDKRKLHTAKFLFNRICRANIKLGKCFVFPVAAALLLKIISCTLNLFLFVSSMIAKNDPLVQLWAFQFTSDALFTLFIFAAADLPADQVWHLRETLLDISTEILLDAERFEIMSFIQHVNENRVRLSTYGIFNVGKNLLPSLVGIILTYMIVLVQSPIGSNSLGNSGNAAQ